ncbi:hypothetical protein ACJJID_11970 [Microbulbifer sp. CnH-101-G]|uniref:hypothetical protein n=1 Tax=Microbulbifer sp. CnH-101-G TaxID=3243393 RepID=UPI00403A744F
MGVLRLAFWVQLCLSLTIMPVLAEVKVDKYSVDIAATARIFAEEESLAIDDSYRFGPGLEIEANAEGDIGDTGYKLRLFGSWDEQDGERRYADIRQASLHWRRDQLSLNLGVSTFFWGVSESLNIVNVLNQADLRQAIDGKEKMGQTFASLGLRFDNGELSIFYLPTFREREFPERPSFGLPISDRALFESSNRGGDVALRGHFYAGDLETGIGYFRGTRRAPLLVRPSPSATMLTPFYIETENFLLDTLYLLGDTTLKLEAKTGRELEQGFFAANVGLEHPIYSLPDSMQDLSLIAEYLIDDRDEQAETLGQNDLFVGLRASFGDTGDSEFRGVISYDFDSHGNYLDLGLEHRLSDYFRIETRAFLFLNVGRSDTWLYPVRDEDFIEFKLHYSF